MEVLRLEASLAVGHADMSCTYRLPPYLALVWLTDHLHTLPHIGSNSNCPTGPSLLQFKAYFEPEMGNSMETIFFLYQKSEKS